MALYTAKKSRLKMDNIVQLKSVFQVFRQKLNGKIGIGLHRRKPTTSLQDMRPRRQAHTLPRASGHIIQI